MQVKYQQDGDVRSWWAQQGGFTVRRLDAHTVHIVYQGYMSDQLVGPIVEMADAVVAEMTPLTLFADVTGVTGYSPRMRMTVTKWTWANRHHYRAYNVLIKPGIIGTTMAAISLRLGGFINLWTDPSAFGTAMQRAVRPVSLS